MAKIKSASRRDVLPILPKRKPATHKGDYGRLLIIGGGSRYVGAPALAGLAALRSGVDLASIAAPDKVAWEINSLSPDLITIKLPCQNFEPAALSTIDEFKRSTAIIVGGGLGNLAKTHEAVIELAQMLRKKYPNLPVVFDADGLKALASERDLVQGLPWVLTPHAKEFEILTGTDLPDEIQKRVKHVKLAAEKLGCVILLKGHVDIIASPAGEVKTNSTGNPGMTVGGTGDVLSGIVGAFLSQKVDPFKAAVAGAWVCGRAGDFCLKEKGYEFMASDLIDKLPEVFKEVRRKR